MALRDLDHRIGILIAKYDEVARGMARARHQDAVRAQEKARFGDFLGWLATKQVASSKSFIALAVVLFLASIPFAMKLGLNYPQGPLEMATLMGLDDTLTVMENLQASTGDDRYRPSQWLRRRALLDLPVDAAD